MEKSGRQRTSNSMMMGPNGQGRFLRVAQPKFPAPPPLNSLEESPWKLDPRNSYRLSTSLRGSPEKAIGTDSVLVKENASPPKRDGKFVDVEESAELGDLNKYAADLPIYHPEVYDDEDPQINKNKNRTKNKLEESQGKGVFEKGESMYDSHRSNPFSQAADLRARVAQSEYHPNPDKTNATPVTAGGPEQIEVDTMKENSNKILQIIQMQKSKQKSAKAN